MLYSHLIQDCQNAIQNQDYDYGFRKLLDLVIATKNYTFYSEAFKVADSFVAEEYDSFLEQSNQLLNQIQNFAENHAFEKKQQQYFVETKDLTKTYANGKFTLGKINLKVEQGQLIGLVGENGNGKTTLLRILAKDLDYTSGSIQSNFETDSTYDQRTKLVYIPQRTPKRYGKVKEHLKFVAAHYGIKGEVNEHEVLMAIARMGLWSYKSLKWSELSSGYKMRFELARVLLRKPRILMLDEPLANLDVLAQQIVLEDLKALTTSVQPMAVILSSQQLYEVEKISDHIVFLKNGVPNDQLNFKEEQYAFILELETDVDRTEIQQVLNPDKIEYNGGYFVLFFEQETMQSVLTKCLQNQVTVKYLRDITHSSRRFFVQKPTKHA